MSPLWTVMVCTTPTRCRRCGAIIAPGELLARHTVVGLVNHPACAGVPAVVTLKKRPGHRRRTIVE